MIKNYKELKVWQKSYRLCLEVYRVTKGFPKFISYFTIILSSTVMILGCTVNPVTQKREIMIYSDADEVEMGRKAHTEVIRQYGKYEEPSLQRYINNIGQSLAEVSHRPNIQYQYIVVDKPFINAFALPGGYVYITRGMLAHLNSEAELAGVLGHETGHITAKHGVKRFQKAMASQLILAGVAIATESEGLVQGSSILLTAALQTYSRKDEHQADELGNLYAFKAEYDPTKSMGFLNTLKKMDKTTPSAVEVIFRTHPLTEDRIERVEAQSQELARQGRGRDFKVRSDEYISRLEGMIFGPGEKDGIYGRRVYTGSPFRSSQALLSTGHEQLPIPHQGRGETNSHLPTEGLYRWKGGYVPFHLEAILWNTG